MTYRRVWYDAARCVAAWYNETWDSTKGIVSEYINANWCGYLHFKLKVVAAEIHEGTIKIGIV